MHGPEALLKSDGAHHRGDHHLPARFEIVRLLHHAGQVLINNLCAAQGDRIADGLEAFRQIRLDIMRERIHAGARGDLRRHAGRQFRVGEREIGNEVRAKDDGLAVGRRNGDDRGASDFAAGACRRGNRDIAGEIRRNLRIAANVVVVLGEIERMRDFQANRFCGIDRRPAAKPDDAIAIVFLIVLVMDTEKALQCLSK